MNSFRGFTFVKFYGIMSLAKTIMEKINVWNK